MIFVTQAAGMAIVVMDPNSEKNFFLQIANYSNYLTPGILVAFLLGMFWRRATATGAILTIVTGVIFSWWVEWFYNQFLGTNPEIAAWLGTDLSFFHRVVAVIGMCAVMHVMVSLLDRPDREKGRLVWTDLGGHAPADLVRLLGATGISLGLFAVLGVAMVAQWLSPTAAGVLAALWTLAMFLGTLLRSPSRSPAGTDAPVTSRAATLLRDDRFWAGILCALVVLMHFYFY